MTQPTIENRALSVYVAPEPMAPRVEILETVAIGRTVAALLAEAVNRGKLALEDVERVRVFLNGQELPRETMLDAVPVAGDVLNLAVMPLGGGRGGNKALQTVLTIALIVLTVWIGGPTGPLASAALFVRAGAAVAVQVAGSMAIQALTAPGGGASRFEEPNSRRALEGAQNGIRQRQSMPLRLGRQRAAFDLAAKPYTQTVGDDVYLHVLFGVHYGPCTLEDIRIGETLLSAYPAEDVEVEYALIPGPRAFQIFPGSVDQENLGDELTDSVAEVHTTQDCERIELDFAWPGGLYIITNKGKTEEQHAHLLIEVRAAGTADPYQPANLPPAFNGSGAELAPGSYLLQLKTKDTVRRTVAFAPPAPGAWDVRVTKQAPFDFPNSTINDATYWTAVRGLSSAAPVVDETLAIVAMRLRSNDDLNGNLPTVSGVVTPIVPVFDGTDWETEEPSSNPLALARWLLTGPPAATPLDPAQIDVSIEDLYALVEPLELEGAIAVLDDATQEDALLRLGRVGRFTAYWNGQRLCFVPDGEKVGPRQVFTGRNASGYRYRRTFPDPLHAVIVEFQTLDETQPWDEVTVYADGYSAANASLFETYRLGFMCEGERAVREGLLYLARRILLVEVHEWEAGEDAIASTLGDRVLLRHTSSLFGEAEATVDHRIFAGGLVAGLRLDEPVTMEFGVDYAIDFRRADVVIRGVSIVTEPGETRVITFTTAQAVDNAPEVGDLLAFGRVEEISEDLEIVDWEGGSDGTVTIRATRYIAEELAEAEGGDLPTFESGLTPRAAAPVPRILAAKGSPDGAVVDFDIAPKRGVLVDGFAVRWRLSGLSETDEPNPWQVMTPVPASGRQVKTPPPTEATAELDETGEVHVGVEVDVEIRTIIRNGSMSNPARADGISCIRGVPEVASFLAQGLIRAAPDGSSYPVIEVAAEPRIDGTVQDLVVQIRASDTSTGDEWISAGPPISAAFPVGDITAVSGGREYDVRARWRTKDNWVGEWAEVHDVEVPAGGLVASGLAGITAGEISDFIGAAANLVADVNEIAQGVLMDALRIADERDALVAIGYTPAGDAVNVAIVNETIARLDGETATLEQINLLYLGIGDVEAALLEETTLRISGDTAEATQRQALAVRVENNEAAIVSEATARATADTATAVLISGLTASVSSANATIASEQIVRASADTALASNLTALSATVGGHTATLAFQGSVLADINGDLEAQLQLVAAAGGDPAYIKVLARNTGSAIALAASELELFNISGGNILRVLRLVAGLAYFGSPVTIDLGSYRLTMGPGFGSSSNLLFWYGPSSIAVSSMTKANAIWSFANDGTAFYGGSNLDSQLGGDQFSVTTSHTGISANRSGAGTATTGTVTVTPSGATGTVSYTWIRLSGAGITANAPSNNATTFSGFVGLGDDIETGFACYAYDAGSGKSASAFVNVIIAETS